MSIDPLRVVYVDYPGNEFFIARSLKRLFRKAVGPDRLEFVFLTDLPAVRSERSKGADLLLVYASNLEWLFAPEHDLGGELHAWADAGVPVLCWSARGVGPWSDDLQDRGIPVVDWPLAREDFDALPRATAQGKEAVVEVLGSLPRLPLAREAN